MNPFLLVKIFMSEDSKRISLFSIKIIKKNGIN